MKTVQTLAAELSAQFEQKERNNGVKFWCKKDDAPEELTDLIHKAHGDFMPDDWKYQFIVQALDTIAETEDEDELDAPNMEPDVYTHDLLNWLASNLNRPNYVDEAVEELGHGDSITDDIGYGQMKEKEEVYYSVLESLRDMINNIEEIE